MNWFSKKDEKKDMAENAPAEPSAKSAPETAKTAPTESAGQKNQSPAAPEKALTETDARFAAYGKIVSVLERDNRFQDMPLRQINGLIGPAIVVGQYAIVQSQQKETGIVGPPVAVVLWATVSEEVDRKMTDGANGTVMLSPQDWKSGDIRWLMLSSGPEQAVNGVLKALSEKLPPGKSFKARFADEKGGAQIGVLELKERPK